jgi:hypothetical protein
MFYDQIIRGQVAVERIERIADACSRANAQRRRRRAGWYVPRAGRIVWPGGARRVGRVRPQA